MLERHFAAWSGHPKGVFRYNIIDDCSPRPISTRCDIDGFSIVRINKDIPWNIAGARNLGFHVATTEWVLAADIDHVVTPEAARRVLSLDLSNPNVVYKFGRVAERSGREGRPAIINILMNRQKFFEIGGYDEDFAGHYGREETFFSCCLRHHSVEIVRCEHVVLSWHPKCGKTRGLARDKAINADIFVAKVDAMRQGTYRNGAILRFEWVKV
jgi:hypothetical protein